MKYFLLPQQQERLQKNINECKFCEFRYEFGSWYLFHKKYFRIGLGADPFCNVLANKDAPRQNFKMAAMGYDVWKADPWHESGDPGVKRQIFDINCR